MDNRTVCSWIKNQGNRNNWKLLRNTVDGIDQLIGNTLTHLRRRPLPVAYSTFLGDAGCPTHGELTLYEFGVIVFYIAND